MKSKLHKGEEKTPKNHIGGNQVEEKVRGDSAF